MRTPKERAAEEREKALFDESRRAYQQAAKEDEALRRENAARIKRALTVLDGVRMGKFTVQEFMVVQHYQQFRNASGVGLHQEDLASLEALAKRVCR